MEPDVDLYTVKVEDLTWSADYLLRVTRNDYVQALVTFFTESLTCKKNEEITGVFSIAPNPRNERDLDFKITVKFHGDVCDVEEENVYTMH
uniref:Uncharacterized protein n=1 Tax=Parascaris equorum TaxID=6256 RepID=A0A914RJF0_PAREQ